jgi:hypothetical protein
MILRRGTAVRPDVPLDPVVKMAAMRLAFEHHKNGKWECAASALRSFSHAMLSRGVVDYDACNLLAECMASMKRWEELSEYLKKLQNSRSSMLLFRNSI